VVAFNPVQESYYKYNNLLLLSNNWSQVNGFHGEHKVLSISLENGVKVPDINQNVSGHPLGTPQKQLQIHGELNDAMLVALASRLFTCAVDPVGFKSSVSSTIEGKSFFFFFSKRVYDEDQDGCCVRLYERKQAAAG